MASLTNYSTIDIRIKRSYPLDVAIRTGYGLHFLAITASKPVTVATIGTSQRHGDVLRFIEGEFLICYTIISLALLASQNVFAD